MKYVSLYRNDTTLECNITNTYVETEIWCPTPSTCAATRIRHSKLNHFSLAWPFLDISCRTLPLTLQRMVNNFLKGRYCYPQLFDRHLSNPNPTYSNYAEVTQNTEEEYTIRLGHLLNSYFTFLNDFFTIIAGINNVTAYFWDDKQTFAMQRNPP
jgi:hypothetical protein